MMDGDVPPLFAVNVLPKTSVDAEDNAESRASDDDDEEEVSAGAATDDAAGRTLKIE